MGDADYTILLVEDDENDAMLLRMAFERNGIANPVHWAKDGLEAVEYLNGQGMYADREKTLEPRKPETQFKLQVFITKRGHINSRFFRLGWHRFLAGGGFRRFGYGNVQDDLDPL